MKVHGRCHCGEIAYEADVDPERVTVCHCADCQMLGGSAWRVSVPADADAFDLRRGNPKIYVKTSDAGNKRAQAFCGNCGSPVYSAAAVDPETFMLRVGSLDRRADLPPKRQIWCDSALPWSRDLQSVASVARQ